MTFDELFVELRMDIQVILDAQQITSVATTTHEVVLRQFLERNDNFVFNVYIFFYACTFLFYFLIMQS